MAKPPFTLTMPDRRTTPVIFASPHSGRDYPRQFRRASVLDAHTLRSSEDAYIDMLFAAVPEFGAPLLCANAPRAYLDLNRGLRELDPALIHGIRTEGISPRIASGLGIVPRVVSAGRAIYRGKITHGEALARIETIWQPYHAQLAQLISDSKSQFGQAILLDCHSMPHESIQSLCGPKTGLPEVVLGDRYGAAASSEIVEHAEAIFRNAGLRVARNKPFAGAFVAQHYGCPARGQHVIQIEIDRSLYMDEAKIQPNADFGPLKVVLDRVIGELTTLGGAISGRKTPLAAE